MTAKKATLLILIPGFAKDENDSSCIPFAQSFIKTLNEKHPSLAVIVVPLDYPFSKTEYEWFGNKILPLNGEKYKRLLRPLKWLKLYLRIKKINKQTSLLGILSFWCDEHAMIAHYFSRRNNLKHFCWIQGQDARAGNKTLLYFKPSAEELIALSDFLQAEFYRNYQIQPKHVIYSAINANEFTHITDYTKSLDVIGVGSLIPLKQYQVFVEVINELKRDRPNIKAILCGKGTEESKIREQIHQLNLENNIQLTGEISKPEVLSLMARSKILLHPSSYEGYMNVSLEALHAGCHVVSFISPEKNTINHWHIVSTKEEMIETCKKIFCLHDDNFYSVTPHRMQDTVKEIMKLFLYNPSNI